MKALHTNITDLQNLTTFERARIDKILGDNRKAFNDVLGMSQLRFKYVSITFDFYILNSQLFPGNLGLQLEYSVYDECSKRVIIDVGTFAPHFHFAHHQ